MCKRKSVKLKRLVMHGVSVLISPLSITYIIFSKWLGKEGLFLAFGQALACLPGKWGSYLRVGFYSSVEKNISQDIYIGFGSYFSQIDIVVNKGVYIGAYTIVGKVEIGENCAIGSNVQILSGNRQHFYSRMDAPIKQQGGEFKKITIGDGCWIGNSAVVMANVASYGVIGAGSVVTKNTAAYGVYGGNPAKLIKYINSISKNGADDT